MILSMVWNEHSQMCPLTPMCTHFFWYMAKGKLFLMKAGCVVIWFTIHTPASTESFHYSTPLTYVIGWVFLFVWFRPHNECVIDFIWFKSAFNLHLLVASELFSSFFWAFRLFCLMKCTFKSVVNFSPEFLMLLI